MNIKYFPGLNGLRFMAALAVVLYHAHHQGTKLNWYVSQTVDGILTRAALGAVDFFFTLSGFLITYLLIQEAAKTESIDVYAFYRRRIFRIWPPYFAVVTLGFVFFGILYGQVYGHSYFDFDWKKGLLIYLVFVPNLMTAHQRLGVLAPLWSIGVEGSTIVTHHGQKDGKIQRGEVAKALIGK